MKTATKILLTVATAACTVSCSLKEKVTAFTQASLYYTDKTRIETGVNACYNPLRSIYNSTGFFEMTECGTDCIYLGASNQYDAVCDITPSNCGCASTVWKYGYQGVSRANTMIAAIEKQYSLNNLTEYEFKSLYGETVVLRAFFYYLLTCTFGDVPFYLEEVTFENREAIASLPRMSADATRDCMIDQLMQTLMPASWDGGREFLPLVRTYSNDSSNRIGAAAGLFLAGKMAMWNKRWDDAIAAFKVIEDIYGDLSQYPLTDIPFSRKFTPESIWETTNIYTENGLCLNGIIAPWATPSRTTSDIEDETSQEKISDIYNGMSIPELGGEAHIYSGVRPTEYYYRHVLPYIGNDLRSGEYSNDSNVPRGGSGNLAWRWSGYKYNSTDKTLAKERTVNWFTTTGGAAKGSPWLGNKFWCWDMKSTRDSNNYKIFRYAGVILALAESYLANGDVTSACRYLNMTRNRAGLGPVSIADVGGDRRALLDEIQAECARELLGEFQRKFELVRWGIWYEKVTDCNANSILQSNIRPCHRYWPIPANEVLESGNVLDNKEYEE